MKCALIRWWMEEYIDGTLVGRRLQWVEKHLQECPTCAQELAWRRSLAEAMKPEIISAPSQEMWQDFQRRLAERRPLARTFHTARWQWGAATVTVACALVLGTVWWSGRVPVSETTVPVEQPGTQNVASVQPQRGASATGGAETFAARPPKSPERRSAAQPIHTAPTTPMKGFRYSPVRIAAQPSAPFVQKTSLAAPQPVASMAYAEVHNEQGELVGKVMLQTTYDANGQPTAVRIECDAPTAVEVENYEPSLDSSSHSDDTRGSAGGSTPAAGARPGLSD